MRIIVARTRGMRGNKAGAERSQDRAVEVGGGGGGGSGR